MNQPVEISAVQNEATPEKVLNVNFVCLHIQKSTRAVPLGAAMVAANVGRYFGDKLSIKVIDCYVTDNEEDNLAKILSGKPDCICFSIYIWNVKESIGLIHRLKLDSPEIVIIIGGPQPSANPQEFSDINEIDYIVKGEAEDSVIPVFQSLIYKNTNIPRIIEQGKLPSPSSLPSPYLEQILNLKKYNGALWELSRGCPFNCAFCYESRGNNSIRRFPIERIKKELELFHKEGISEVFVLDPTFNYNKSDAKEILKSIAEIAPDIHYSFEIRAEFLDEEMVDLFCALYCTLQIGLQSIHTKVLKNINRTFNKQKFDEKVFLLHQAQLAYGFDLIYGLPGDTLNGFLESLDFAFSLAPNHVDIFPLSVLPGTELYENAKHFNLEFSPENDYALISSSSFTEKDMAIAASIASAVDLFYNQGKAVTWLDLVLSYLNITASNFFSRIAEQNTLLTTSSSPLEYQKNALSQVFCDAKVPETVKIAHCLATYFWHNNSVYQEPLPDRIIEETFVINPQIQTARFEYNPLEIISFIEEGITDFELIMDILNQQDINMIIYSVDDEIAHLICTDKEYEFLCNAINGKTKTLPDDPGVKKMLGKFESEGIITKHS